MHTLRLVYTNMSILSRFSNFISLQWRHLANRPVAYVTAGLCSTSQMKMLNDYDLN